MNSLQWFREVEFSHPLRLGGSGKTLKTRRRPKNFLTTFTINLILVAPYKQYYTILRSTAQYWLNQKIWRSWWLTRIDLVRGLFHGKFELPMSAIQYWLHKLRKVSLAMLSCSVLGIQRALIIKRQKFMTMKRLWQSKAFKVAGNPPSALRIRVSSSNTVITFNYRACLDANCALYERGFPKSRQAYR